MSDNIIDEIKLLRNRVEKLERWIRDYEYKNIVKKEEPLHKPKKHSWDKDILI
jgi:hypothetical protein